ncbi:MAG TPA: SGNH/GDSL hydrolase family protein, partial [Acidimicrobiales bacterium]
YNGGFGVGAPADLKVIAGLGWTAAQAQPRLSTDISNGRPAILVEALGTNDSNPACCGGWTSDDVNRFRLMINSPHPSACVVVVLPGYGPGATQAHKDAMYRARLSLRRLIAERPRTVEVDWYPLVRDDPSLVEADGIHLSGAESWAARSSLYWEGVAKCATV